MSWRDAEDGEGRPQNVDDLRDLVARWAGDGLSPEVAAAGLLAASIAICRRCGMAPQLVIMAVATTLARSESRVEAEVLGAYARRESPAEGN